MGKRIIALSHISRASLIEHLRSPLYGNGYALVISSLTTSVLGFLYWVLASRWYDKDIVGFNATMISTMTFVSTVTRFNLNGVLIRFLPRAGTTARSLILRAYTVNMIVSALVGLLLCFVGSAWLDMFAELRSDLKIGLWFIVSTTLWGIFTLQDGALSGMRQSKWVPIENTTYAVVKLLLLVALAALIPAYGVYLSWTIPLIFLIIPINWLIFKRLLPTHIEATKDREEPFDKNHIRDYLIGDYTGSLLSMAYTMLPLPIINQVLGNSHSADFNMAWMIASSLQLVATNMSTSLMVEAAFDQSKLITYTKRMLVRTLQLILPAVIGVVVLAPIVLHLFGKSYVEEGTMLLRLLALATLPTIVTTMFISLLRIQRRMKLLVSMQAFLCVSILGIGYFLLPRVGVIAFGISWLVSQTILAGAIIAAYLPTFMKARG
jgi:O-antigen/teichoic acid export membrane protein